MDGIAQHDTSEAAKSSREGDGLEEVKGSVRGSVSGNSADSMHQTVIVPMLS